MRWRLVAVYVFSFLAIAFLSMALFSGTLTSFATSGTVIGNVSVTSFFAIALSSNLSNGISFDEITTLPATNINSTDNYNSATSGSTMYVNVSTDSDNSVDFCVKVNAGLRDSSGGSSIGAGNESYANSSDTNLTLPFVGLEVPFTTSYVKASAPVGPGNSSYYRFWLDVPSGIESGTYNNTINFKGVISLQGC